MTTQSDELFVTATPIIVVLVTTVAIGAPAHWLLHRQLDASGFSKKG